MESHTEPDAVARPPGRLRVARLSIAPVRSLALQHPAWVELTAAGVAEDRRFYLIDDAGRIVDRLSVGSLVQVAATIGPEAASLTLRFPDDRVVRDEVSLGAAVTTSIYGTEAHGHVVDGPWAEALSTYVGANISVVRCDAVGGTRAGGVVSLLGDGSVARLAQQLGVTEVDTRRFRMLIELGDCAAHLEDGWLGRRLAIGDAVIRVTEPIGRCAIVTQDPDSGARDLDVLRAIIAYRGLRDRRYADFGVLAEVERPGRVRLGDHIEPVDAAG